MRDSHYSSKHIHLFFLIQITEGVVSYSMPQGDVFRSGDLIDETYDGIVENGFLKGRLFLLSFLSPIFQRCIVIILII